MPKNKTDTHIKIIAAAKKEFLEKGFEKASMRDIAANANMSAAGLYRHFKDKEDLFDTLIDPLMNTMEEIFIKQTKRSYTILENGNFDEMWSGQTDLDIFLNLIYENYDKIRLLICCSGGTKHKNFVHEFVSAEEKETLKYMSAAREKGYAVKEILPQELHLLLSAYFSAIFEIVMHEFTREDAEHYLDTLQKFFYPGWRNVLGL
ncbi:MAG: TetR/AcrR family transcriptional regulator [Oscillospiraceae bacterium]|jgi:AcrR family transcriptional regulator